MDKRADILRAAGLDVSTLDLIFQADMETIHRLTVPGVDAIATWEELRGLVPQTGPWPEDDEPHHAYHIPLDLMTRGPRPRLHVGLVSTPFAWQTPAYLRYGAWNACPSAAEHVALFRYWGERYGAEVVGMAGDVVEMKVARPPTGRDDALELAGQQYLYC